MTRTLSPLLIVFVALACNGESPALDSGQGDLPLLDTAVPDAPAPDAAGPDTGPHVDLASPDAFAPLPGFGTLSGACGELDDTEWNASTPFLFRNTLDLGSAAFDPALLSAGGQQIWNEGNRGGSSLHSEVFAFEVLHRCELAQLLKTESNITYTDAGGKKTDLLTEIDARKIGVSVTRAFHYPPTTPYTVAEAKALLDKKLADLPLSQANATAQDAWVRSILHVLAYDGQYGDAVQSAWSQVDPAVKGDAILLLTVTDGTDDYIY